MHEAMMLPLNEQIQQVTDEAMQCALQEAMAGRIEQAGKLYRAILELQPGHAEAHFGLAMLEQSAGNMTAAIPHFAAALQGDPERENYWLTYLDALMFARQFSTAHELLGLGRSHGLQGHAVDAIEQRLVASGAPTVQDVDEGTALFAQGRYEAAGEAARLLTERFPQHGSGWKLLGAVHYLKGEIVQAMAAVQKAVAYAPDDAETLSNLGLLLQETGQAAEAERVLRRSITLQPHSSHAHNHLALALLASGRLKQAQASASTAVALDPTHAEFHNTLAMALDRQGRSIEAVDAYRRALELAPERADLHSNMLLCMSRMENMTPSALFAEHLSFGERLEQRIGTPRVWPNTLDPRRCLRIGFVSGDLRNHALASFVEPIFERLAGRQGLALHAYYTFPVHDAVTERLRGYMAQWRDVAALRDAELDELICADGIDILIDLAGHTAYNRLPLFARKPAPLQATWIGYPGTTGLRAVDYYLTDRFILPPGQYDHLFTEKLVHLPVSAPFAPVADGPEIVSLPALANGYVTFGSFNRVDKIRRNVVALWCVLLRALPEARMLVAGLPEGGNYEQLQAWFAEERIDGARVRFQARTGIYDYLALHNQVDINLDTFPYSGGTTTLHAMWMGVPTLTLIGDTAAGRQTACILEHNGLAQFASHDADDFVRKGIAASTDLTALSALRATMRAHFPRSTSDDITRIADGVENALRMMWRGWCAALPAVSFEAPQVLAQEASMRGFISRR
ncbi:tetratricopeptide repeat protein [Massilia sp. H6]|uniref:O-linked N-acetylglucosamine transferase, SPINDLY family protein n=1 Tax=Massilia sp. H6 TaxID=2970464 RepID=UPI002169BB57|nr:tetratricopeptide repeat protein [Massilia sp. H6]UVW27860.1 tetratricopeptide repeat protein [Massilia sp. H6]